LSENRNQTEKITKSLRVASLLIVFFLFCTLPLLSQPVQAQNEVTATINVGGPFGVAVTPNGANVYVTKYGSGDTGTVSVISTATNKVTSTITLEDQPYSVAITPNGAYAYVTGFVNGSVSVISTATNKMIATIIIGGSHYGVAVTPNGDYVYVTNYNGRSVSVISTVTNKVTSTITVGYQPWAVGITPNGKYAYVTNNDGTVSIISTATNTVTSTITVGRSHLSNISLGCVGFTPDGEYVYVANTDNSDLNTGKVSVISTATNKVTSTITVGLDPMGVAVTPNGAYVYVTNYNGRSVSVISTVTNKVTSTITVGDQPFGVGITPNGKYAYVATWDNVSIISTATNTVTSTNFWSQNLISMVSVASISIVGIVSVVSFNLYKKSRRNLWNKLVAKGEALVKKNDLVSAAKCFAKATIVGFKDKTNIAAVNALERYTKTTKSQLVNSILSDTKTEASERISKLHRELVRFISDRSLQTLVVGSSFEGFSSLDLLIDKASENDLDFMVNTAFKVPEIQATFLGVLKGLDEVLLVDLAAKLGYSVEVTFKLLSRGISLEKVKGYITSDDKKYVSEEYVQKQLSTHLG
jgi:YVTN family beta-propeller protein